LLPIDTSAGFLYTPQQLAGSNRFGSGVLLGNWREDDALDDMRVRALAAARRTHQYSARAALLRLCTLVP
jgi:hypothetical protein